MKLLLARHGQTAWNAAQRFQGHTDIPLNATGLGQAAALAARLAGERFDVLYTSDLQRAQQTADAIAAACACPVRLEPHLREVCFGEWEGLTYDEIRTRQPQTLAAWEADIIHAAPPGGETLAQLAARVQAVLDDLLHNHKDETVLLAAHGGPLQVLLCLALGLSAERYWQFNLSPASLSELVFYPAGAILNRLNDTCHLEEDRWES